ncbi:putative zinc metalloprotease [Anaerocolumna cellulosilytica]|uniref:Zinc metalloprotease n=1 Tax=Anaerocolumna cellulosilytica TaxID=433286 RepID=A0A6S6R8X8_9FIRM|nr:RIP metalloprotease RseP [Anaerocolumna cellulosilytica]MBB5197412.1 regulator of sigma E protease [Anaerocolumna cellulosilytica]BCJ95428.1 putative zinc metalloprotease [Anaerocolumna cellulosilytica]
MNIIIAILIFSVIIVIHELGHFLLAKKNGIFVTEFSVGMGPRLISLVKTEEGYRPRFLLSQHEFEHNPVWKDTTKYSIKLLPIGGSCMMMGEDELVEDDRAFNKKGVWARISVVVAGPLFNFILAFLLAMIIVAATGYDPAKVTQVVSDSPAAEAGILPGDVLTELNGRNINIAREALTYLQMYPLTNGEVSLTFARDGKEYKTTLTPQLYKKYLLGFNYPTEGGEAVILEVAEDMPLEKAGLKPGDIIVDINGHDIANRDALAAYFQEYPLTDEEVTITYSREGAEATVNVTPALYSEGYSMGFGLNGAQEKTDFFGVIKYSAVEVKYWIVTTIESIGLLVGGKVSANDMAGPVGIVSMIGDTYQASKSAGILNVFINMAAISILLSANLGVMNLLPIPALDGGRLVFLLLEVFRGKPIDQAKEGMVHMIGLIALMLLMVFVMFNDLSRIF